MPYKKLNKLDKLAHKGVIDEPDYYTCIEEQMDFVTGISNQVSSLLAEYWRMNLKIKSFACSQVVDKLTTYKKSLVYEVMTGKKEV